MHRGRQRPNSFAEVRTLVLMLGAGLVLLALPLLRAINLNGDNLDDAWEAQYGITTNAYDAAHLVGWWQMDGGTNVADRSPNHLNGRLVNFTTNAFVTGLFSNALSVTPHTQVNFPAGPAFATTNGFTFSAWFKAPATNSAAAGIATWSDQAGHSWQLGVRDNGDAAFSFITSGATQSLPPGLDDVPLFDGGWHHLASTWTPAGQAVLYVDGSKQSEATVTQWQPGEGTSFVLDDEKAEASFLLDEVRLYNRALSANEITQLPVTYTDLAGNGVTVFDAQQRHLNPFAPFVGVFPHAPQLADANAQKKDDEALNWTPWFSNPELDHYLTQFDTNPPGKHPNFWDKGHWMTGVEGRWANNRIEYRIAYSTVPPHKHYGWYWWINQPEDVFQKRAADYTAHGFTLLHSNFFTRPTGEKRYQGVWHWLQAPDASGPAAAAEVQRALEENKPQKL